jgi:hypothetical protein
MADISTPNTALATASDLVRKAAAAMSAATVALGRASEVQGAISAMLVAFGVTHRWVGTRLDLMGPDGEYVEGPDLRGASGSNGWYPIVASVIDGERRLLKVTDWIGGQGSKPPVNVFVSQGGYTSLIGEGTDFRGMPGGLTPEYVEKYDAVISASAAVASLAEAISGQADQVAGDKQIVADFFAAITAPPKTITDATYTLQASDVGRVLRFTVACVVTMPADLPAGFYCVLRRVGEGDVTWSASSGATVHSAGDSIALQWVSVVVSVDSNADSSSAVFIVEGEVI